MENDLHQKRSRYCFSFLDVDECALADKGGCEHKCSNYEGGYYCTCNAGYRLMDDDKGCEGTVDGQRCQMRVTKLWCYIMQKLRKIFLC